MGERLRKGAPCLVCEAQVTQIVGRRLLFPDASFACVWKLFGDWGAAVRCPSGRAMPVWSGFRIQFAVDLRVLFGGSQHPGVCPIIQDHMFVSCSGIIQYNQYL